MLLGSSLRHLCLPWECEDILLSFLTGAFRFRSTVYTELNIVSAAAAAAKSLQSCPTLCNPIDGSSPGSPVPGILQARTLEWAAISFSIAWKWKGKVKSLSRVRLLATPLTAAYQAPLPMGFSRQEYWSGVPSPSPNIPPYVLTNFCLSVQCFMSMTFIQSLINTSSGTPLQYLCLENPMGRGAW